MENQTTQINHQTESFSAKTKSTGKAVIDFAIPIVGFFLTGVAISAGLRLGQRFMTKSIEE